MAELKTKPTDQNVLDFLTSVEDEGRRQDCLGLIEIMGEVTGEEPRMWGASIIGFGSYHYRYASGHEGDSFLTGFAPRKRNLTLYLNCYLAPDSELLARLGKHKIGKACLYIDSLDRVDRGVLRDLVEESVKQVKKTYC